MRAETRRFTDINGERVEYTAYVDDSGKVRRTEIQRQPVGTVCGGCPICAQGGKR